MARFLHGLHDEGGESLHGGKPGWTFITEEVGLDENIQGKDYNHIAQSGIGVIVRLNYSHGGNGTIPNVQDYDRFAKTCASYVRSSKGVAYWVIGNEPNHVDERPHPKSKPIEPEEYALCFYKTRKAIKQVMIAQEVEVGHAAIAPYTATHIPWPEYLLRMLIKILDLAANDVDLGCDFLNYHAYARSMNPDELTTDKLMDEPLENTHYGFSALWDAISMTPASLLILPAMLSEFDITKEWENSNTGIIRAMYSELNEWNVRGNAPQIIAGICFRWLVGLNKPVDWGMEDKPQLLEDFKQAAQMGYPSPQIMLHRTRLPSVKQGTTSPPKPTEPPTKPPVEEVDRDIDQRLLERGVKVHEGSGDKVWRLKRATKVPSDQSGGRHHIYVEAYDEAGNPVKVPFQVKYPGSPEIIKETNGKKGFDAGNFNMTPGAFDVWIKDGQHDSDAISGIEMGEMTPTGWNAAHHTSTILEFHLEETEDEQVPSTPTEPTPQPPSSGNVPPLAHPIVEPSYRILSQGFGARPEYYKQYTIDGVPLKGHEGLDFDAPIGARVQAVDAGTVTEVGNQGDKGYGKYVKVVHQWGETVYAHLQDQWVAPGTQVTKGQHLGTVGYSGNVQPKGPDGAHLHFGMRVNPYNRRDGWGGYLDPTSYLKGKEIPPTTQPTPSPEKDEIIKIVREAAREFGISENLLISLIHGESSFNPRAENKASGAKGLGQIRAGAWADTAGRIGAKDIFNAKDNARVTAAYLKWCMGLVGGKERQGLWAYNWSPRDVPKGLTPPDETIHFASKILHGKEVLDVSG